MDGSQKIKNIKIFTCERRKQDRELGFVSVLPVLLVFQSLDFSLLLRSAHRHEFCPVHQQIRQLDRARLRTYHDACTAVVALTRIHHERMFSFFR